MSVIEDMAKAVPVVIPPGLSKYNASLFVLIEFVKKYGLDAAEEWISARELENL